jgi:hypothetical protein
MPIIAAARVFASQTTSKSESFLEASKSPAEMPIALAIGEGQSFRPPGWMAPEGGFAMMRPSIYGGKAHSGALRRRWFREVPAGCANSRSGAYLQARH